MDAGELRVGGYLSRPEQLVRVGEYQDTSTGLGRVLSVALHGGLQANIHLDRGIDIGDTWYKGQLISWVSPTREADALQKPTEFQWLERFNGGLVVTCGLENVGAPIDGHGLHGTYSHRRGTDINYRREILADRVVFELTGTVSELRIFGRRISVYRTIRLESSLSGAKITVSDRVANEGLSPEPIAILYHVNLGAPLNLPGTKVVVNSKSYAPREEHADIHTPEVIGESLDYETEAVYEYLGFEGSAGEATVSNSGSHTVKVKWDRENLPLFFQWIYPSKGGWALGLEPSNAPMWGSERENEDRGMRILQSGEDFETRVDIEIE
ncbi:MAG: DUF4432 family protein [Microbacteriaceae bacterium]|nr:DUF4432 family protein [Microbacteriaceae bacterium]